MRTGSVTSAPTEIRPKIDELTTDVALPRTTEPSVIPAETAIPGTSVTLSPFTAGNSTTAGTSTAKLCAPTNGWESSLVICCAPKTLSNECHDSQSTLSVSGLPERLSAVTLMSSAVSCAAPATSGNRASGTK